MLTFDDRRREADYPKCLRDQKLSLPDQGPSLPAWFLAIVVVGCIIIAALIGVAAGRP